MRHNTLNDSQLEAVNHRGGPLLVLAGAGTGKTRVITHRIAHLIGRGIPASSILALSFTNKAAREVAERVVTLVGERGREVTVSTFHSLGLNILKEDGKRMGLGQGFTLVSEGEKRSLVRQIARESVPDIDPSNVGDAISRWKNQGLTAAAVTAARTPVARGLITAYTLYEGLMNAQRAVDFDDLLLLPLRLFNLSDDARIKWSRRFSHTLVDEYQDTNLVQFELLKVLAGVEENLTVVGDDDQAIYGWRGAQVELILRFPQHFPGCRTVVLEDNYRSTSVILDAAHAVVSGLKERHPKRLKVAARADGTIPEPVLVLVAEDEEAEAEEIASSILAERFRTKRPWEHFAVLYRTNGQSRAFEQALRTHDIPHTVHGGNRFFDHKEVRDVLSYLKVILNPKDDAALIRIANVPKRGLGHQTLIRMKEEATAAGTTLLVQFENSRGLPAQARAGSAVLLEILKVFRARFFAEGLTREGLQDLMDRLNLEMDVRANYESARAVQKRLEILNALPQTVETLCRGRKSIPLDEFIESLTLDPPEDREEESARSVSLMTLHAAKGLEFPIVFLTGMEEGLLPLLGHRGVEEGREEEERRLCYVGMTRAKSRLTLSRALSRKRQGAARSAAPSRFLLEVPSAVTEKGREEAARSEETQKERASAFFENIRKMLGP